MIRVDGWDLEQWRARSTDMGLTLSEWVRRKCNEANVEVSGTETRRVHEGRVSRRLARQVSTGEASKDTPRKPPKERDMAAHAEAESPSISCCPHKKSKGELCYKCDPKFGLPSII